MQQPNPASPQLYMMTANGMMPAMPPPPQQQLTQQQQQLLPLPPNTKKEAEQETKDKCAKRNAIVQECAMTVSLEVKDLIETAIDALKTSTFTELKKMNNLIKLQSDTLTSVQRAAGKEHATPTPSAWLILSVDLTKRLAPTQRQSRGAQEGDGVSRWSLSGAPTSTRSACRPSFSISSLSSMRRVRRSPRRRTAVPRLSFRRRRRTAA